MNYSLCIALILGLKISTNLRMKFESGSSDYSEPASSSRFKVLSS